MTALLIAGAAANARAVAPETLEASIAARIDAVRAEAGAPALAPNAALAQAARDHSAEMARTGALTHRSTDGRSVADRVAGAGYPGFTGLAENVAYRTVRGTEAPDALARLIVDQWLGSPGHRRNLLATDMPETGIGVAFGGGAVYVTQVFAAPRR